MLKTQQPMDVVPLALNSPRSSASGHSIALSVGAEW
jgi:hypothetical protein